MEKRSDRAVLIAIILALILGSKNRVGSAIFWRLYINYAADQAVRVNMHVVPVIWVSDIGSHVRNVVRVPFDFVEIKYLPSLFHDQINQLLHLGKSMNVVRRQKCKVGEVMLETLSRFLHLP